MKRILLLFSITLFFASCTANNLEAVQQLKEENTILRETIDSLNRLLKKEEHNNIRDLTKEQPEVDKVDEEHLIAQQDGPSKLRTGRHFFTLHWISWDHPGTVIIQKQKDEWYSIEGRQDSRTNDDYIVINGRIKVLDEQTLLFEGKIESKVASMYEGKPCVRTGEQLFKSRPDRKYWRLQHMQSCEGGMVVDYIDIYYN